MAPSVPAGRARHHGEGTLNPTLNRRGAVSRTPGRDRGTPDAARPRAIQDGGTMTRRAVLLLPLALAAVAAPGGGVAHAGQTPGEAVMSYTYAVTIEGTADYSRHTEEDVGLGVATEDATAHLGWTAQVPQFAFLGTMPTGGAGPIQGDPTVSVDFRTSVPEAG